MKISNHTALGLIDVQRGFMPKEEGQRLAMAGFGELPITHGEHIIPYLNRLIGAFSLHDLEIFTTQDWHPKHTAHFSQHPNHKTTWEEHCVGNTPGAMFHPELMLPRKVEHFKKGMEVLVNGADDTSYSGFNGINAKGETLGEWATERGVSAFLLGGLALDYCVKATAQDLRANGYDVTIAVDAVESVAQETALKAIDDLEKAGVQFVATDEYLRRLETMAAAL